MEISRNVKIKCEVTPENTAKIMECLEEQFGRIAANVNVDDTTLTLSTIKGGLDAMHNTNAVVVLKEAKDGKSYTINVSAKYNMSVAFWISLAISILCMLILVIADAAIVFYNKKQIETAIDNSLKAVVDEID